MKATFFRLLEEKDKESSLQAASQRQGSSFRRFDVEISNFSSVPGSPFPYWVSEAVRGLFTRLPLFQTAERVAAVGVQTSDDFRFLRLWAEVSPGTTREWVPFAKGGAFSPFYSEIPLAIRWDAEGQELKASVAGRYGSASKHVQNQMHYFRPGLTWPRRTQGGLSFRAMARGCIFADKGPAAFVSGDGSGRLLALLAITNSQAFAALVNLQMAFGSYEVGVLQRTPVPDLAAASDSTLAVLAGRCWSHRRRREECTENSHAFSTPALLRSPSDSLAVRAAAWADRVRTADAELVAIQAEIDDCCFNLYGINDEDRAAITEGFGGGTAIPPSDEAAPAAEANFAPASVPAGTDGPPVDESDADEPESNTADATTLTADLLSWSIGVAFGRFDLRLSTGDRAFPPEPDPFDPLPACSPGMLTGADGLPSDAPPSGYPIDIPQDGVLLDDPGHPRDLSASARAVFDVVFGGDADARWQEAAGILDPKNHDLRAFVARTFFEQHLKRYSKSRRKAPIYWQLATPSASYSVWLYAHRLTPDTFFHVLHDVVAPKLGLEERKLLSLTQEFGPNPTASQRKEIAGQETFVDELRAFRDEVTRIAPLWKPDLDDGVVLTMAPLWRLVPQHRAWQKELKAAWDSLCAGEYDWAHVAMHLWPERVVPKCATDRSLAIAHGLDEVFWEEDSKGKWAALKKSVTPVATLVAERISPAVKAALKDLVEAPVPGGAARATGSGKRRNG